MQAGERIQKRLSELGLASRRQAEGWIREGRVVINGRPAVLGQRVLDSDDVRIDGRAVRLAARSSASPGAERAFLCHRSPGEGLLEELAKRLPKRAAPRVTAVSPMPRVDGGLEILAVDGSVVAALQQAVRTAACEFTVRIRGRLDEPLIARIRTGTLDAGEPVSVSVLEPNSEESEQSDSANHWYRIVAQGASGKEIRQLFERNGALVSRVIRTALGPVLLTRELPRGRFRPMTAAELASLGVEATTADSSRSRSEQGDVRPGQRLRRRQR